MDTPEPYEKGFALLIGLRYSHWPEPLSGPLKDVKALSSHFSDLSKAAYRPENLIELTEKEATTDGILKGLDAIALKAAGQPDATVIIYYSGHGGNFNDKYFLVPYDFNLSDFNVGKLDEKSIIQTAEFAAKINSIQAKKCMIFLDCCHAENIPVKKKLAGSKCFMGEFADSLDAELTDFPVKKDLNSELNKGTGRVILTSCEADESSLDLGSMSLFTKVLLECLNGKENIENDGWVRLIDLMRYVPKKVAEQALIIDNHDQHPMFKRIENLRSEDFIICAYDLPKTKAANTKKQDQDNPPSKKQNSVYQLIDTGDYPQVFHLLDTMNLSNQMQYNRFKREFSAGLKGIDLIDFGDRLKVFIDQQ